MNSRLRFVVMCLLSVLVLPSAPAAQDAAVLKELSQLEDIWATAIMRKDGAAVGKMLAPGFLSMSDDGRVLDKAMAIQDVSTDKETYVSTGNTGYKAQVFGNTAIIVGVFTAVAKTAAGTETRRWAWTDTWMKQADGQWLCIASQSTRLAK